jgi:hypothetical protein
MMRKLYLLLALLTAVLVPGMARAATCASLPYIFNNGVTIDANQINADLELLRSCIGSGTFIQGLASVSTFAALKALPTTPGAVVMLTGYYQNGDMPSVIYIPLTIPCPLNGGLGDGGSQAPSLNNLCWQALYPGTGSDIRSWGAQNGIEASTQVQTAVNTSNGQYCILFPVGEWVFNNITLPSGTCFTAPGWGAHLLQSPGTTTNALNLATGGANYYFYNLQMDGNKSNNPGLPNVGSAGGNHFVNFDLGGNSNVRFVSNWIHDTANDAIYFSGDKLAEVNNYFTNIGGTNFGNAGAVENQLGGAQATNFLFQGNTVDGANGPALACGFAGCHNGSWVGNVVKNAGQGSAPADGITAYDWQNTGLTAVGNVITNSGNNCIHLGGSHLGISGNSCDSPVSSCFTVIGTQGYATGTVTVTSGSTAFTGIGTAWVALNAPMAGNGTETFVAGTDSIVSIFTSNTTGIFEAPFSGVSGTYPYSMKITMPETDVSISGNQCHNAMTHPQGGIVAFQISGLTIASNSVDGVAATGVGIWNGSGQNFSIVGNTVNNSIKDGIYSASQFDGTGTANVTNGSPNVSIAGTNLTNSGLPMCLNCVFFKTTGSSGDTGYNIIYTGTITGNTTVLLSSNYQGPTNGAVGYYLEGTWAPANGSIANNIVSNAGTNGITMYGVQNSTVNGNSVTGSGIFGIVESAVSFGNKFGLTNQVSGSVSENFHLLHPTPQPVFSGGIGTGSTLGVVGNNQAGWMRLGNGTSSPITMTFVPPFDASEPATCAFTNLSRNNPIASGIPSPTVATLTGTWVDQDYIKWSCQGENFAQ